VMYISFCRTTTSAGLDSDEAGQKADPLRYKVCYGEGAGTESQAGVPPPVRQVFEGAVEERGSCQGVFLCRSGRWHVAFYNTRMPLADTCLTDAVLAA